MDEEKRWSYTAAVTHTQQHMAIAKKVKDWLKKYLFGKQPPEGLFELQEYFRLYEPISFEKKLESDGFVAISTNFRYGSIITHGKTEKELDTNIKDAILTSFEIPSSYAEEAKVVSTKETHAFI